jgi:hypothetical protein
MEKWVEHSKDLLVRTGGGCVRFMNNCWYSFASQHDDTNHSIGVFVDRNIAMNLVSQQYIIKHFDHVIVGINDTH